MAYVMHCAHCGIDAMGVNNPLMSWNTMMKANMVNMLCSIVADILAMNTPRLDMTRLKRMAARYTSRTEPSGTSP